MAHTIKWEHRTDSFHENHRIERKSRSAGRLVRVIENEILADQPSDQELAEIAHWKWEAMEWRERQWLDDYDIYFDYEMEMA